MGLVVSDLLVENFPDIMDPKFTAGLEDDLDRVAEGKVPWQQLMRDFYGGFAREAGGQTSLRGLAPEAPSSPGEAPGTAPVVRGKPVATGLTCPKCGKELLLRRGRLGEFLGCSGYPKCKFTQNFTRDAQGQVVPQDPEADAAYSCPREGCGGDLTKRRSRRGIFYGCRNHPKCAFTMNQAPQERACPKGQFPW